ncbi:MAG: hypothetical protein ACUVTN_01970 [Thermodesulfobacteriota bacterium]
MGRLKRQPKPQKRRKNKTYLSRTETSVKVFTKGFLGWEGGLKKS